VPIPIIALDAGRHQTDEGARCRGLARGILDTEVARRLLEAGGRV